MYEPTSSRTSAPSEQPIGTSKSLLPSFFTKKISTTGNVAKTLSFSNNIKYSIKWFIVGKVHGKSKICRCPLCLAQKLHLVEYFDDIRSFNKRSKLLITVDITLSYYFKD